MITTILSVISTFFLLYGRFGWPIYGVVAFAIAVGLFVWTANKHHSHSILQIDVLAHKSKLKSISPTIKFITFFSLMVMCIFSKRIFYGLLLFVLVSLITVYVGGLDIKKYINLISLPMSFLMLSCLVLLFEFNTVGNGVLNFKIFGYYLVMTKATQIAASLVISRSMGALVCLYAISVTTPMSDLIETLHKLRCPKILINLMYLIYRYAFLVMDIHNTLKTATVSRLGFSDFKKSMKSSGLIYTKLFMRSYANANVSFDAMESRCFNTEIRFYSRPQKPHIPETIAAGVLVMGFLVLLIVTI